MTHDPQEYIKGLQQILISDKKKLAFLFGAGTSIPHVKAIKEMTEAVEGELENDSHKEAVEEIKKELDGKYNIETLLSNLEQKYQIIGSGSLNGLDEKGVGSLIGSLKKGINKFVSVHGQKNLVDELAHIRFAEWIGRANRKHAIEIFTTNYDYLFEIGLEGKNIPFYDGFTGGFKPFFNAESVEDMNFIPNQTKLWKVHGSLGWHYDEDAGKICRKESDKDILIYPSTLKYAESKKQPYTSLMDRLTNFLKQPDTVLIICGYSFGDEHINERIITALNSNDSGHAIALFFDKHEIDDKKGYLLKCAELNRKLSVYSFRQAVIGGQIGEWKLKREPDKDDTINVNLYFDEDAPIDPNAEVGGKIENDAIWTGEGEFILPDFQKFVSFLSSMIIEDESLRGEK